MAETLTLDEIRESGEELARFLDADIAADEKFNEKKAEQKQIKLEIQVEITRHQRQVSTGKREIDVDVEDVLDGKNVQTIRVDTGEVLRTRHATQAELQGTLYGIDDERSDANG